MPTDSVDCLLMVQVHSCVHNFLIASNRFELCSTAFWARRGNVGRDGLREKLSMPAGLATPTQRPLLCRLPGAELPESFVQALARLFQHFAKGFKCFWFRKTADYLSRAAGR
jgi:hypothetical protein